MFNKTLVYVLIIGIIMSLIPFNILAELQFSDLTQEHWAYDFIMQLVSDGTVAGFDDGEFKAGNTVSRAQFVKMIGQSEVKRDNDFADVSTSHWGYDYIMYSGLDGDADNNFSPDIAIKRFEVLNLIWKRAGSIEGMQVPSVIAKQADNKDALAWGYTYGIMVGDDGIHLRLDDTLTRAEAAALIIRARNINAESQKYDFVDTVAPEILETVFNSVKLFDDIEYKADATITNGEMARAAIRLGLEEYALSYRTYMPGKPFDHDYVVDLFIMANACLGEDLINETYIDKPANVRDTLTALSFNNIKKAHKSQKQGSKDNYYKDLGPIDNDLMNICLTYAYNYGIHLYADGGLKPDKEISLKEFAAILLQLDDIVGTQSSVTVSNDQKQVKNTDLSIEKDLNKYPANADDFQCIVEGIPVEVYTMPFVGGDFIDDKQKPKRVYDFSREYGEIFIGMLQRFNSKIASNSKIKMDITYYPFLVANNGNGYTLRVKCEVVDIDTDGVLMKDIFGFNSQLDDNYKLSKGSIFYADIITGQKLKDIHLPADNASIEQIINM